MRPSDPISTVEAWLLRIASPAVGLGLAVWMGVTRSFAAEGAALALGLVTARPIAGAITPGSRDASSTPDSSPPGD